MTDGPLRVLLVDDYADDTTALAMLLRRLGLAVTTCNDPTNCLEQSHRFRPHLILIDYAMPGRTGPEVARELRAENLTEACLLVARTGYTTEQVHRECLDAGFSHVLIKPVDVGQLTGLLEEARAFAFGSPPASPSK